MRVATCVMMVNVIGLMRSALLEKPKVLEEGSSAVSQVTTMTWNTDALFAKTQANRENDVLTIQTLAVLVAGQLRDLDPNNVPEFTVLHLQEVTSCASKLNGLKMGFSTTFEMIDLAEDENPKHSNIKKTLRLFGLSLGEELNKLHGGYKCAVVYFFQAIGSIICSKLDLPHHRISRIMVQHFGESSDNGKLGLKFGFKGGISVRIRFTDNLDTPDLMFVNMHVSSKRILDRRRHFMKMFRETILGEYKRKDLEIESRSTIFFFAGDFNVRTGTNMEGVGDRRWASNANAVGQIVKACNLNMVNHILRFPNLGTAFNRLGEDGSDFKVGPYGCKSVFQSLWGTDEYNSWFQTNPDFLNILAEADRTQWPAYLRKDGLPIAIYSPILEGQITFLPSYCLQKRPQLSYGHLRKGGIVHYTDRIFYAVRQSQHHTAQKRFWTVQPVKYNGHTLGFLSDHATVFGTFRIEASRASARWFPKGFLKQEGPKTVSVKNPDPPILNVFDGLKAVEVIKNADFISYLEVTEPQKIEKIVNLDDLSKRRVTLGGKAIETEEAKEFRGSIILEDAEQEESIQSESQDVIQFYGALEDSEKNIIAFNEPELVEDKKDNDALMGEDEVDEEFIVYGDPNELVEEALKDDAKAKLEDEDRRRRNALVRRLKSFQKIR